MRKFTCAVARRLPGPALERLEGACELKTWPHREPPAAGELRALCTDVDGLLCLLTDRIDADLLASAPRLRAISNYAVGVDNIDLDAARAAGIPVGCTPDVLTDSTADLAFALMLAIARRLPEAECAVRGFGWLTWEPEFLLGRDIAGATLGIVGGGRIGQAVALRAEGFGMEILIATSRGGTPLPELLERSDFVSLHCPLTPATEGLIGAAELRRMKPTAYLVNTARGAIVDSAALRRALGKGEIAGAALDVTNPEPLPPDHPLLGAPNLLVVPHIGSATHATRERMADMAVDNLLAGLVGRDMPHPAA